MFQLHFGAPHRVVLIAKYYCVHAKPVGEIIKWNDFEYYCHTHQPSNMWKSN